MDIITALPKSRQAANYLQREMESGRIPSGTRLDTIRNLAEKLAVGRQVVASAFKILEKEGWIESKVGCGTFVKKRSSVKNRLSSVLFFIPDPLNILVDKGDYILTEMVQGVIDESNNWGELILLNIQTEKDDREIFIKNRIASTIAESVILFDYVKTEEIIEVAKQHGKRCVLLNVKYLSDLPDNCFSVLASERNGTYEATNYLLHHGHKHILFLESGFEHGRKNIDVVDRKAGYLQAIAQSNTQVRSMILSWNNQTRHELIRIMSEDNHPTAVITVSDEIAFELLEIIKNTGKDVPRDVSLVGFDDSPRAGKSTPTLTTVAKPRYEMGRTAVRLAFTSPIELENKNRQVVLSTKLITRDSTRSLI